MKAGSAACGGGAMVALLLLLLRLLLRQLPLTLPLPLPLPLPRLPLLSAVGAASRAVAEFVDDEDDDDDEADAEEVPAAVADLHGCLSFIGSMRWNVCGSVTSCCTCIGTHVSERAWRNRNGAQARVSRTYGSSLARPDLGLILGCTVGSPA